MLDLVPPGRKRVGSCYDILYRGYVIRLDISPCSCGIRARWLAHNSWGFGTTLIEEWHWRPNVFQRLMKVRMERPFRKWMFQSRRLILQCVKELEEKERRIVRKNLRKKSILRQWEETAEIVKKSM